MAGRGVGSDRRVADPEIEQDRGRHDRHADRLAGLRTGAAGAAKLHADAALVEPAHHAAGRIEPECAAARQQDRVDLLDCVERRQQLGFAGAGRRAPHVDAGHRAGLRQDPVVQPVGRRGSV
jgi:hypothetical protein